jgi:putative membrane protein
MAVMTIKRAALFALLIGISAIVGLTVHEGVRSVASVIARGGWIILLLVPIHALPLLPDALGWRSLLDRQVPVRVLFWIASVRQAVGRLLPVASVGGELVGIRLLSRHAVRASDATASVVVEVLMTMVGEFIFVLMGIFCLAKLSGAAHVATLLLIGLALTLPLIVAAALLLRHGSSFERLQRLAQRIFLRNRDPNQLAAAGAETDAAIRELCRQPSRLLRAASWQLFSMLVGCIETWAALRWLAGDGNFLHALVLESLSQAARHIVFIMPAGLGVQEVSLLALGQLLGIGGDAALALSLAKRMSEVLYGIPALLSWQWFESRALRHSTLPKKLDATSRSGVDSR